jgi:nucleoside phosphorylase
MIQHFPNIKVIFMVGIAGGTPIIPSVFEGISEKERLEKHVRLGDIVVGSGIVQYDYVKNKGFEQVLKGTNTPPCASVMEARQQLDEYFETRVDPKDYPWNRYIEEGLKTLKEEYRRPGGDQDVLHDYEGSVVAHPSDPNREKNFPRVYFGKVASANSVLKDPRKRDELKKKENVFAIEMETSGVADATWEAEIGYYAVRGIVDYCDSYKNDDWHKYSALAAAAFTRAIIEKMR